MFASPRREDIGTGLIACSVDFALQAFDLERREETLGGRIVPDLA
ncbi:MAG: hypothetical protein ACI92Z_001310 [Paracoccaceae bacterium]|jgi:hypothetical protein